MAPHPTDKDMSSSSHVEEQRIEAIEEIKVPTSNLKLGSDGLPLEPQPSNHKDDPLNWPKWYKYYVLLLLCLLAFIVQFGAGMLPAAFASVAKDYGVSDQKASYLTTCNTLFGGITPLFLTPFVNMYGRRPAYVLFTLILIAANIGSGYAPTYATQVVARCVSGIGASVALAIGGATICDMFFQGERGRFIGFYALALTNGPHFGPIAGGYIALNLGWRWIFFVHDIMLGAILAVIVVSFPETLFSRTDFSKLENLSYWNKLAFRGKVLDRQLRMSDFLGGFRMLKYWTILIPCVYYMTANTYGSILLVLTASHITQSLYGFNSSQTGILLGVPLTIGCLIGESCTGWVSDWLINRYARRHDGYRKPEARLYLCFLGLLLPAGLIVHGVCISERTPWIGLAIGMGVTSIGVQAATTLVYSYLSDCYKPQAAEVLTLVNLFRQMFAFTVGFYALPFGEKSGFDAAWGTFASIQFATWIPLTMLIWKGEGIRKWQGSPKLHQDL